MINSRVGLVSRERMDPGSWESIELVRPGNRHVFDEPIPRNQKYINRNY